MPYHAIHRVKDSLARAFGGRVNCLQPFQWLKDILGAMGRLFNGPTELHRRIIGKQTPLYKDSDVQTDELNQGSSEEVGMPHGQSNSTCSSPSPQHLSPRSSKPSQSSDHSRKWVMRADEAAIKAIGDEAFISLLLGKIDPTQEVCLERTMCRIIRRTEGSYNHCVVMSIEGHGTFAIKVPFTGTKEIWSAGDAHNFRREAQTMEYIRHNTKVPIPEIIAFDDTLDNIISAPYILMRGVQGVPALAIWIGTTPTGEPDVLNSDEPSVATYNKRLDFLKSLAYAMAELRGLKFDKIGMLDFSSGDVDDTPTVGPYYSDVGDGSLKKVEPYSFSKQYYDEKIESITPTYNEDEDEDEENDIMYGVATLFRNVYDTSPFKHIDDGSAETFVLAHPDLDFQNIYTDRQGNVVGIIDWDMTRTVPRYVGYASLPLFLRKDFEDDYDMASTHPPWVLEHYRGLYSKYMLEALSDGTDNAHGGDAVYTPKSALYHAAFAAIGVHGPNTSAFISLLMKAIPALWAVDKNDLFARLGSEEGWSVAYSMLNREVPKLFNP